MEWFNINNSQIPDETSQVGGLIGYNPHGKATLIVGCGNLLRGDDGVGSIAVRHLADMNMPQHVQLVDGGTAGMDVAFAMRGMERVIIIDAAQTGAKPGTIFKVPGEEVEQLPPLGGMQLHAIRWDHALAFSRWLLKEDYPSDIQVWLIEAGSIDFGADLTPEVSTALQQVLQNIATEVNQAGSSRSE